MSDFDVTSDLQRRLAQIETTLLHLRLGKVPAQPVDPMTWRLDTRVPHPTEPYAGWRLGTIARCLREDWHGMTEAIRNWGVRFEEHLSR